MHVCVCREVGVDGVRGAVEGVGGECSRGCGQVYHSNNIVKHCAENKHVNLFQFGQNHEQNHMTREQVRCSDHGLKEQGGDCLLQQVPAHAQ